MTTPRLLSGNRAVTVKKRYLRGDSTAMIALYYGCNAETVSTCLRKQGVPLRTLGEAGAVGYREGRVKLTHFGKGDKNPRWNPGQLLDADGYVRIRAPLHPRANRQGYVVEHILVMEAMLGRPLEKGEVIHHKDRVKANNKPSNLELMPSLGAHRTLHIRDGDPMPWARSDRMPKEEREHWEQEEERERVLQELEEGWDKQQERREKQ